MRELLSVIVPVYNTANYLKRCINSILKQTHDNIEVILVDDGSTDGSGDICDHYAEDNANVSVIHKTNGGLSSARNAGIAAAHGAFIGFVDSDDWIAPDMYAYMADIQAQYNADVVQVEYVFAVDESVQIDSCRTTNVCCYTEKNAILRQYLIDGMKEIKSYPVWTKLYKRECFDDIFFPVGRLYEDVVTNYDILNSSNIYVVSNKQFYYYFVNPQSITRSLFKKKDLDYIVVGEDIKKRTADKVELADYGRMTLGRTHFMCLCKMMKYDIDPQVDVVRQIQISMDILRETAMLLFRSKMKMSKKIVLALLCINKRLTVKVIARKRK